VRTLVTFMVFSLARICLAQGTPVVQPGATQEETNRMVATRVFEEIFNQGRFEVANEIYSPHFRNHGRLRDAMLEEDQKAVHREKEAFPDLKMAIDLMIAQGDFVSVVWTFSGTHTGAGVGLPPTGTRVTFRGTTIWRIVDGKITEEWTSYNELPPYLQVARHLRWFLLAAAVTTVVGVVILERVLWKLLRTAWRRSRYQAAEGR
jgi:predicted ester cyclase